MLQMKMEPQKKTPEQVDAEYSAIIAMFKVASRILAIRFFLFLSLVGSFILSIMADNSQTSQSAYILLIFAAVTTFPLSILELWGKRGG